MDSYRPSDSGTCVFLFIINILIELCINLYSSELRPNQYQIYVACAFQLVLGILHLQNVHGIGGVAPVLLYWYETVLRAYTFTLLLLLSPYM